MKVREASSIEQVIGEYEERRPICQRFTTKLHTLLEELIGSRSIRYSVIESRCKTLDSFREKITCEGKKYADPLSEITDQCGIRVILYYTDDLCAVGELIAEEFDIDASTSGDKRDLLKPHEFGYASVHYVVSLNSARSALPEWQAFTGLRAEIQIRTVLQHAWASISHAIDYKHELDVPSQLRRKLFRLSALLELADDQFAALKNEKETLASRIEQQMDKGELEIELNMDTLREYISSSKNVASILKAANQAGFEVLANDDFLSEFVSDCRVLGVSTITELQDHLETVKKDQAAFLKRLIGIHYDSDTESWSGPASFYVLVVLLYAKRDTIDVSALLDQNWQQSTAENIVTAFHNTKNADSPTRASSRRPKGRD